MTSHFFKHRAVTSGSEERSVARRWSSRFLEIHYCIILICIKKKDRSILLGRLSKVEKSWDQEVVSENWQLTVIFMHIFLRKDVITEKILPMIKSLRSNFYATVCDTLSKTYNII